MDHHQPSETAAHLASQAEAHHGQGLIAFEAGDLAEAASQFVKAIALNGLVGTYHRNLGELCRRLGRLPEAVLAGSRAVELSPQDVDAHVNLGLALADQFTWGEAVLAYQKALALNPSHGPAWNNMGVALDACGRRNEAQIAYANAVQADPRNVQAQLNLGRLLRQQGRLADANACFAVVCALAPAFAQAQGVSVLPDVESVRPPRIEVRDTHSARGRGVFAMQDFAEGELVESCPVLILQEPFESLPAAVKTVAFNWGVLCGVGSAHALALGYGSLYNHANPATLRYVPDPENLALAMFATRDVKAGEELTINYNAPSGLESVDDSLWFGRMNIAQIA
jgi:tetratricopeptide (TPR) repeat protein